jgi:hypothetical protein
MRPDIAVEARRQTINNESSGERSGELRWIEEAKNSPKIKYGIE